MAKAIQALLAVGLLVSSPQALRQQVPSDANQSERNKEVVRLFFEKQNHGDARGSSEEWAETAANDGQPIPGDARRVFQMAIEDLRQTFPDWHVEIVDLAAQGDSVVALCRVSGTHRGIGRLPLNGNLLMGMEPTGKRFDVAHIHWFTVRGRKLVDHRVARDDIGMYKQLGVLSNGVVSETSTRLAAGTRTSSATGPRADHTQEERNRRIVTQFFERENGGDVNGAAELTIGGFSATVGAGFEDLVRTFPDWHWSIIDVVADGDAVVVLTRASGTHRGIQRFALNGGLMVGVEPTGKHFETLHIHWFTLRDGKIVHDDRTRDDIGMYRQLGLLPQAR
jgi:predicted ester cyclase